MAARNLSIRAEQRKLRERMRGLGMSHAEVAAEMGRKFKLRPRAAWRVAWGWTLEEAAERFNALRARNNAQAVTSLTGSRLSEWENWPLSTRRPPLASLCLLAEIYQAGILDRRITLVGSTINAVQRTTSAAIFRYARLTAQVRGITDGLLTAY